MSMSEDQLKQLQQLILSTPGAMKITVGVGMLFIDAMKEQKFSPDTVAAVYHYVGDKLGGNGL